jgi:endonuclease YncB( thermonuclease family)
MIDDSITRDPKADPRRNWTQMRDRMREIIHAELDRIHPTDDARRALELIIESSVRPSEVDGALKLTIIDHDGKPRAIEKNGRPAEFTLHDLLDELRVKYPVLFRPAKPDAAALAQADEPSQPREKPKRDWLNLDSDGAQPAAEPPRPLDEPAAVRDEQGPRLPIAEWSYNPLKTLKTSVMPDRGSNARAEDGPVPVAEEHERNVFGDMRSRSWTRPAVALGAVAVLALLGVGAFLFQGDDAASPRASAAAAPVASSAAAASPIREPEPAVTGSTGSSGALRGVPDVIDTATLSVNGEVVRLFGVEWAPGAGKPEDLTQYLNGREVACDPAGSNDVYRCQVGGQDLSRVVLFNGGGRPTSDATPDLKAAADKAREAKIGVWSKTP